MTRLMGGHDDRRRPQGARAHPAAHPGRQGSNGQGVWADQRMAWGPGATTSLPTSPCKPPGRAARWGGPGTQTTAPMTSRHGVALQALSPAVITAAFNEVLRQFI